MRGVILLLSVGLGSVGVAHGQPGELIERTLAIVGGQAITLSDVRTALALQLIDAKLDAGLEPAVFRLIDRVLMLREVQRYVPTEPDAADIDRGVDLVRRRFASPDALASTLAAGGFTEARLRAWVRDDLRIAAYLAQRFAAVGVPTDEEVACVLRRAPRGVRCPKADRGRRGPGDPRTHLRGTPRPTHRRLGRGSPPAYPHRRVVEEPHIFSQ